MYPNLRMLSEALRDQVGFGPAKDFLIKVEAPDYLYLLALGRG